MGEGRRGCGHRRSNSRGRVWRGTQGGDTGRHGTGCHTNPGVAGQRSALAKEPVLRERLVVVAPPCCEVGVGVRLNVPAAPYQHSSAPEMLGIDLRIDVIRRREVVRIAAIIDPVRVLIDSDVVDLHLRREGEVVQVDVTEVKRHAKIGDDVHRFLRYRTRADLHTVVCGEAGLLEHPDELRVRDPADVL